MRFKQRPLFTADLNAMPTAARWALPHLAGALLIGVCQFAGGQNFPDKPVRLVVANPPGGTADLIGRMLARTLAEKWGQSTVVDNRAGGAGVIGTELVANAMPNGYTLLISAPGPITTAVVFQDKLPYRSTQRSRSNYAFGGDTESAHGERVRSSQLRC